MCGTKVCNGIEYSIDILTETLSLHSLTAAIYQFFLHSLTNAYTISNLGRGFLSFFSIATLTLINYGSGGGKGL